MSKVTSSSLLSSPLFDDPLVLAFPQNVEDTYGTCTIQLPSLAEDYGSWHRSVGRPFYPRVFGFDKMKRDLWNLHLLRFHQPDPKIQSQQSLGSHALEQKLDSTQTILRCLPDPVEVARSLYPMSRY